MRLAFLLPVLAALPSAQAQTTSQPPSAPAASRWNFGLKLGAGTSYHNNGDPTQKHPLTAYTGGVSGGYSFPLTGGFFNLQADALLERRGARPWQTPAANNVVLFTPIYLRTDRPAARVHFLLGGGPTVWLSSRTVPDEHTNNYGAYQVQPIALLGFEIRLLPLSSYETSLALTYRAGLTPASVYYRSAASGGHYTEYDSNSWFGATVNVYFHPVARH